MPAGLDLRLASQLLVLGVVFDLAASVRRIRVDAIFSLNRKIS